MEFRIGDKYNRLEELADFGGTWQSGIITSKDNPYVFIITGQVVKDHGYENKFLEDGTFLYTGQGSEGDMDWRFANRSIRDHKQMGKELHLFERKAGGEAYMVTYVGEYEYSDHDWIRLPDTNQEMRDAIRFHLIPAGGREIAADTDITEMSTRSLYQLATRAAPQQSEVESVEASAGGERTYLRSDVVREFALQSAAGVCQGCTEDAPFVTDDGSPFLEVHHIRRLSDGGADHPDNVIALCPNCHRRVHKGRDGTEFNQQLQERAANRDL